MGTEIFLDLEKITLLGWEENKSLAKVKSMINRIQKGIVLSPVYVTKINDSVYSLIYISESGISEDGGHHRAIAHYKAGKPLNCILSNGLPIPQNISVPIKKINLI